ncbi:NTP pyrophosphohydrolase [Streptomyces sp. ISL-100]|uniref:NTP pyrophosphohydrolase n=1 Tax=Streptomyces sp. ISL-100 TaxID=2819173 RepID=UPI001BEC8DAD|nr:NTP pyrophosphohydrolase [Streptomyces sp. ISL-100]MBT2396158.1 NTP pyrophosphohydrolase [Streptomyces sp. ISL-100]
MRTLVVVDAANVVGSVPDGWWRDRRGAAERLRDHLQVYAEKGIPGDPGNPGSPGPLAVVLVVEGAARGVASVPGVRVESAPGSGDDRIVEVVAEETGKGAAVLVVTADRELRRRVEAYGAQCAGPRTVRPQPGGPGEAGGAGGAGDVRT